MGGGVVWGRTTGAKALFCLAAAEMTLAGEKEKTPWAGLQLETDMVGLEGTTATQRERQLSVWCTGRERERELSVCRS